MKLVSRQAATKSMTVEFDAISLQTAQLLLLYQSVKVEKTRHGSPRNPQQNPQDE